MTEDPKAALEAMRLLPLGGAPETGSHKGFGLALAIDILSGIVSGGPTGRQLASAEASRQEVAGIGHFVIAIRLRAFTPWIKFRNRIKDMMRELTSSPAKGAPRVYYPGEAEYEIEQERRASGIPIDSATASELEGLARPTGHPRFVEAFVERAEIDFFQEDAMWMLLVVFLQTNPPHVC